MNHIAGLDKKKRNERRSSSMKWSWPLLLVTFVTVDWSHFQLKFESSSPNCTRESVVNPPLVQFTRLFNRTVNETIYIHYDPFDFHDELRQLQVFHRDRVDLCVRLVVIEGVMNSRWWFCSFVWLSLSSDHCGKDWLTCGIEFDWRINSGTTWAFFLSFVGEMKRTTGEEQPQQSMTPSNFWNRSARSSSGINNSHADQCVRHQFRSTTWRIESSFCLAKDTTCLSWSCTHHSHYE